MVAFAGMDLTHATSSSGWSLSLCVLAEGHLALLNLDRCHPADMMLLEIDASQNGGIKVHTEFGLPVIKMYILKRR